MISVSIAWPDDFAELHDLIKQEWGAKGDVLLLREFREGKSGARVFVVDIETDCFSGMGILKLTLADGGQSEGAEEKRRTEQARQMSPRAFVERHLPTVVHFLEAGDVTALLCSLAGKSLKKVTPVFTLDGIQQLRVALQLVSHGVLHDWNQQYSLERQVSSPVELFDSWLGHRLDAANGAIAGYLEDELGIGADDHAFSLSKKWFPNPYYFASSKDAWGSHGLVAVRGHTHGDLHGYNALLKINGPVNYKYYLIDFSNYKPEQYLFYDTAYLEFSYLLEQRGRLATERWLAILTALRSTQSNQAAITADDEGVLSTVRLIRRTETSWIHSCEPEREDHLQGQVDLARVAVGLNFVNKLRQDRERMNAFLYAAEHMRRYLEDFRLGWEPAGRQIAVKPVLLPRTSAWREVWNSCSSFNDPSATYVLIAGPQVRNAGKQSLAPLGRIPWSLVVDFDRSSASGGLFDSMAPTLRRRRDPTQMTLDSIRQINYERATCFFMADGIDDMDETLCDSFESWRRAYIPILRDQIAREVRAQLFPNHFICLIANAGLEDEKLRCVWEALDEVLADDGRYIVLGDSVPRALEGREHVQRITCTLEDLAAGLWETYGDLEATAAYLPHRSEAANRRTRVQISEGDLRYLEQDLEVIHPALSIEMAEGHELGHDFWRGHEITWKELDIGGIDVPRNIASATSAGASGLKEEVVNALERRGPRTIKLQHSPGSGGTTVAKRIAWDLKDYYPAVRIRQYSDLTATRIEHVFRLTDLPVLVVIEARDVLLQAREQLYKSLTKRKVSSVLLYVVRSLGPKGEHCLADPMSKAEARR